MTIRNLSTGLACLLLAVLAAPASAGGGAGESPAPVARAQKEAAEDATEGEGDAERPREGRTLPSIFEIYRPNYFVVRPEDGEVKFQVSFRARLVRGKQEGFFSRFPLYFGFTQTSFWDLLEESSPFEESNYNPELFFIRSFGASRPGQAGWAFDRVQFGADHESNGLGGDDSRSWNRVYVEPRLVYRRRSDRRGIVAVSLRLWPIVLALSDNPDIRDFYGYGELGVEADFERIDAGLSGRLGTSGKGSLEAHFAYRPGERVNLRLYVQGWTGYGESLIGYNVEDTSLRAGIALGR